jgi:hypothetical protein
MCPVPDTSLKPLTNASVLLAAAFLLGGCAATPDVHDRLTAPVEVKRLAGAPPVRDGRARFREIFCSTLRDDGLAAKDDAACGDWLWRLPDEPAADDGADVAAPADLNRPKVILVTGAFSECVAEASRPFAAGAARLGASGTEVRTVVVGGRSGTGHNARQIAAALDAAQFDAGDTVIAIGYSKGGLDLLRFLVDFPEAAQRVDAVVSVATPVFGTPLADLAAPAYAALAARVPYRQCPPGDGQVIRSLQPEVVRQWLAAHPLPTGVRYYSLANYTTSEHVARALRPFWKRLGDIDPRNDGQVVAADAVIPGGTLLGYANADHWGIAQTIESVHPVLAARPDPELFPLEQLLLAIVAFVDEDLRQRPAIVR